MFDIRLIRDDPSLFDAGLARRGIEPLAGKLIDIDAKRRDFQTKSQTLQTRRNELSKKIGELKARGGDASDAINEVASSKAAQSLAEKKANKAKEELENLMSGIPNIPMQDVPFGQDDGNNIEVSRWGEPTLFDYPAKTHFEIGEALGMMDFETAAKMSGARFSILSGDLALLERALGTYMLDLHTRSHGYTEVSPPALVRNNALFGTGQLPKFEEDLFQTSNGHWLIPTAEVPLTNMVSGQIVPEVELPKRFTALTPCFRSEAGAAGRDTRGMIRQHQFSKVELVSVTDSENSELELERMTSCAEEVLKHLGLPFRRVELSTGDLGFSACKTYDLEVWLPGQKDGKGAYREISSCSMCGDFQARRMNARYRSDTDSKVRFVHTLNGSGVAVGRALIAVLENNQQEDGSVNIPDPLRPYMNNATNIKKADDN
ncbi:MAG: serine--tRNA ligase [Pseudomonadota bacterium]|nr:serine--tRNA ligase [Pseudomonadota bacterium]